MPRGNAGADYPNTLTTLCMDHDQYPVLNRLAYDNRTVFFSRMEGVVYG